MSRYGGYCPDCVPPRILTAVQEKFYAIATVGTGFGKREWKRISGAEEKRELLEEVAKGMLRGKK